MVASTVHSNKYRQAEVEKKNTEKYTGSQIQGVGIEHSPLNLSRVRKQTSSFFF